MAHAVPLLEQYTTSEGDVRRRTIRYSGVLDDGEKLTGTPVFIQSDGDLQFSGAAVNSGPLVVTGRPTKAGESLSYTEQGQLAANGPYRYTVRIGTTKGQTLNCDVILNVAGQPSG